MLQRVGPQKPMRTMTEAERHAYLAQLSETSSATPSPSQAQGFLETSFTAGVVAAQRSSNSPDRQRQANTWDCAAQQILHSQVTGSLEAT